MANTILRSNHKNIAIHVLGLFSLLVLIQRGGAYEFKVGGSSGWTVPSDSYASNYNQWAEKSRFQIGDTLLFVYPANNDAVLQVTKDDYSNCHTANPIAKHTDGHTVFKLNQSGPFYFISGVQQNCLNSEKLVVVVMADRSSASRTSNETTTTYPPPPADIAPSPPPAGDEYPSPPTASVDVLPAPTPSATSEPNGASSDVTTFVGSAGAFIASSYILLVY